MNGAAPCRLRRADLASWAGSHRERCEVATIAGPDDWEALLDRARHTGRPVIARGAGLSWTDIAMTSGGYVADTTAMTGILAYDPVAGRIAARSGTTLAVLLDRVGADGWALRSLPGSLSVTLGGAVAGNVHGKDSFAAGAFCEQVETIGLLDGRGAHHELAPGQPGFDATVGGLGLTGLVTHVRLRLTRQPSRAVDLRQDRCDDPAALAALAASGDPPAMMWGWCDPAAAARGRFRALVRIASWSTPDTVPSGRAAPPHGNLPWSSLAPFANNSRLRRAMATGFAARRLCRAARRRGAAWREALFPHDRLRDLNRLFPHGFAEQQAILPPDRVVPFLERLARTGTPPPFLVAFKLHRSSPGLLSFAGDGLALSMVHALDRHGTEALAARRGAVRDAVIDAGGRLNLARDGDVAIDQVRAMYPGLDRFLAQRRVFDPDDLIASAFWRRLAGAAA